MCYLLMTSGWAINLTAAVCVQIILMICHKFPEFLAHFGELLDIVKYLISSKGAPKLSSSYVIAYLPALFIITRMYFQWTDMRDICLKHLLGCHIQRVCGFPERDYVIFSSVCGSKIANYGMALSPKETLRWISIFHHVQQTVAVNPMALQTPITDALLIKCHPRRRQVVAVGDREWDRVCICIEKLYCGQPPTRRVW